MLPEQLETPKLEIFQIIYFKFNLTTFIRKAREIHESYDKLRKGHPDTFMLNFFCMLESPQLTKDACHMLALIPLCCMFSMIMLTSHG